MTRRVYRKLSTRSHHAAFQKGSLNGQGCGPLTPLRGLDPNKNGGVLTSTPPETSDAWLMRAVFRSFAFAVAFVFLSLVLPKVPRPQPSGVSQCPLGSVQRRPLERRRGWRLSPLARNLSSDFLCCCRRNSAIKLWIVRERLVGDRTRLGADRFCK